MDRIPAVSGVPVRRTIASATEALSRIAHVRRVEIRVRDRGTAAATRDGRALIGNATVEAIRSGSRVTWLEAGAWYGSEAYTDSAAQTTQEASRVSSDLDGLRFRNELRWAQLGTSLLQIERPRPRSAKESGTAAALDGNLAPVRIALVPDATGAWVSAAAHLCGKDLYTARLELRADDMTLVWIVRGPKKDLLIACRYRA
jgi:hypothetical protein